MEEEIKLLEKLEFIAIGEIEDIKELEKFKVDTTTIIRNLINKYKEQEKTIQLMSEELAELNYEYCGKWCKGKKCKEYYENHFIDEESCNGNKLTCIIDYFKKKARDENGNRNDN